MDCGHFDLTRVLLSDEKMYNFGVSDNLGSFRLDFRLEPKIVFKVWQGDDPIMARVCISYSRANSMIRMKEYLDSRYYFEVLEEGLLPQIRDLYGDL